MKLVAVTRVLNEEDVVEAFVRHTATFVDHHVLLDNGSSDRTLEILAALHREGISITVLQNAAPAFVEVQHNTLLYQTAISAYGADWVLCLDADEFIDARAVPDLRAHLAAVPQAERSIRVELANYDAATPATQHALNVTERIVLRYAGGTGVWKVFVRGGPEPQRVAVDAGNHQIFIDGQYAPSQADAALRLAHFGSRSPLHWAAKAALGWMKVLAAGHRELAQGRSSHYRSTFELLKTHPEELLRHAILDAPPVQDRPELVADPIGYRGGPLRYTETVDQRWRMLRLLLGRMEQISMAYGALLDATPSLREQMESDAYKVAVLMQPGHSGATPQGSSTK